MYELVVQNFVVRELRKVDKHVRTRIIDALDKMAKTSPQVLCKNIFKSRDNKTIKAVFTQKWIELINQFEKNKNGTTQL